MKLEPQKILVRVGSYEIYNSEHQKFFLWFHGKVYFENCKQTADMKGDKLTPIKHVLYSTPKGFQKWMVLELLPFEWANFELGHTAWWSNSSW